MSEKITLDSIKKTYKAVEKARESERPFPRHNEDGTIDVIGDANQTELNKFDVIAHFVFRKDELEYIPDGAKEIGKYVTFNMKFDDVFINPRENLKYVDCMVRMMPFWEAITEIYDEAEEKIKKLDSSEKDYQQKKDKIYEKLMMKVAHEYAYSEKDVQSAIYDLVATLLNLDEFMEDHMSAYSAIECVLSIINNNPELINESELVFTRS